MSFAAAMTASTTQQINQLVALRMGEVWPPMLARAIATVDHMSQGRQTVHQLISSDLPGLRESNEERYARSSEIIQILQKMWQTQGPMKWEGKYYHFELPTCEPAQPFSRMVDRCFTSEAFRHLHNNYVPNIVMSF